MKIIKDCLRKFLLSFVDIYAFVISYESNKWIKELRDYLYTRWIKHFVGEWGVNTSVRYPLQFGDNPSDICLGSNSLIREFCVLEAIPKSSKNSLDSKIIIGDNCDIGAFSHITAVGKIEIGNGVLTGRRVLISNNNHGDFSEESLRIQPNSRTIVSRGDLVIEDNVWIGEGASILGGLIIGRGTVVGANAVVTKDIPPYSLVVGNPARIVKQINM